MLTALHRIDRANEVLYEGTHVRWHDCQSSDCPQETAVEVCDRDSVVATLRHCGSVYVMNASGQTVGTFHLPSLPGQIVAGV